MRKPCPPLRRSQQHTAGDQACCYISAPPHESKRGLPRTNATAGGAALCADRNVWLSTAGGPSCIGRPEGLCSYGAFEFSCLRRDSFAASHPTPVRRALPRGGRCCHWRQGVNGVPIDKRWCPDAAHNLRLGVAGLEACRPWCVGIVSNQAGTVDCWSEAHPCKHG